MVNVVSGSLIVTESTCYFNAIFAKLSNTNQPVITVKGSFSPGRCTTICCKELDAGC